MMRAFTAVLIAGGLLVAPQLAVAADVHAMITTAMKAAIDELAPSFERTTGHKVHLTFGPSGGLARRLDGGEFADLSRW